jgi:glycosyltransferase involved in cell wall biosynthesis
MKVGIDARLAAGHVGGVQQLIFGLAHGLGQLAGTDEEFVFVVAEGNTEWLVPYLKGSCRAVVVRGDTYRPSPVNRFSRFIPAAGQLRRLYHVARAFTGEGTQPAPSSGVFEGMAADVVHFPLQTAELVALPNIYHPHDLQHVHYSQYFTAFEKELRDHQYRAYCANASVVAVASNWIKQDLVTQFGLSADKIRVVPLAPPNEAGAYQIMTPEVEEAQARAMNLLQGYFFYPAHTWPHKNHAVLIDALATLHRSGRTAHLVFSGRITSHKTVLERQAANLGLDGFVHFVGFVTPQQLQVLYRRATACVIPSLFEAASFPAWEAFLAGAPVAVSNITSLPEQVGDAGLLFDAKDVAQVGSVLIRLWDDLQCRETLRARGFQRVRQLSWRKTALHFRAIYRMLSGHALTEEDVLLLASLPVV